MNVRMISNPPHPFDSHHREFLEPARAVKVMVYGDETREILSRNDSPDLPFRWSVNPYGGCLHACAYCYARPTHEYWGFGAGTDFDSKIIVKEDAPRLLRRAFERSSWRGELIVFSGNTDCYQPLEACYGLTRACLEVCAEYRNPVGIITKGALTEGEFFRRHTGKGIYWNMIEQLVSMAKRRAGFAENEAGIIPDTFRRPRVEQVALFNQEGR